MKINKKSVFVGLMALAASGAQAQQIPVVGGLLGGGIPVLGGLMDGGLPGGDLLGGGIPVVGGFAGGGIPVLGGLMGGGIPVLGDLAGGGDLLGGFALTASGLPLASSPLDTLLELSSLGTSVLGDPSVIFNLATGTGLPLAQDLVPIVGILTTDPASLPTFLLEGGTIISPTVAAIPAIPLLTSPLGF